KCGKRHGRPDDQAGSMVFCECGQGTRVPWASTAAPEAPLPEVEPVPPARPRPAPPRPVPAAVPGPVPIPDALPPAAPAPSRPPLPLPPGPAPLPLGPRRLPVLLGKVNPNFCFTHDELPREETCSACKLPFCKACVVTLQGQVVCGPCKNFRLAGLGRPPRVLPAATLALVVALVVAPVSFVLSLVAMGLALGEGLFAAPAILLGVSITGPALGLMLSARALRRLEERADLGGRGRASAGLSVALVAGLWCAACLLLLSARSFLPG